MDNKGFTITPTVFLLFIPIMILAASFGNIVEEINNLYEVAIGGDVTYTVSNNIVNAITEGTSDGGRNAIYNATRKVIDDNAFMSNSKNYVKNLVLTIVNEHIIFTAQRLETETGREITINGLSITNSTPPSTQTFFANDMNITQTDPFGFHIVFRGGIPFTVRQIGQNEQLFQGTIPPTDVRISIENLEDPYIWVNVKNRQYSSVIYNSPYHTYTSLYGHEYHLGDYVSDMKLHFLWEYLNGTNNPSQITPRPYYFPDPSYGLTIFDRLENKTSNSSSGPAEAKMSTFMIGDPLYEDHGGRATSKLDHEYFAGVSGTSITLVHGSQVTEIRDPMGEVFYLSTVYKTLLGLQNSYNY
jgi:hypothetical protein